MRVDLPDIYNAATTFVDENIRQGRGKKTAIYFQDEKFTYQDLFEKVNQTGNALKDLGLEHEQRLLLVLPDSPEFAFAFFGAIKIGAVPIPTNPWMKAKDYEYLLQDSRARILVVHESALPEVETIWDRSRSLKHVLVVGRAKGRALSFESQIAKASTKLEAEPTTKDDVVMWNYTSGSTGPPKGAVHLQHDMITITELFVKPVLGMREDDVCFSASKLFFSYGLGNSLYFPFRFGASTVLWPERPEPERVLQVIDKHRPTFFFSVPTLYARLLRVEKKYDLSSLRICLSSGEPLPPALFHQWREKFGQELLDVVKGDSNAPCYWNKHEQTKKTMLGEWLKTGDTYYRDKEGYYWYCGRSDDMLKVGGMWVSPIEIENTLLEHPSVLEAAVTAHADQDGLIKPKAYVLLKSEYQPGEQLKEELQNLVKNKLAPYKYPRWIDFVDDLPKTVTGKIQRFKLRHNK